MKNFAFALALTAVFLPTTSSAGTKNFEGFSAGLNLNMLSAGIDYTEAGSRSFLGGKQAISAGLDAAYGFNLSDSGVLTVGLEADVTSPEIWNSTDGASSAKQKNRYGIYIAPGALINKDTMVYGKVGYNSMKGDVSSTLLELLNPEQSNQFRDSYLDLEFDFSECIFICTSNSIANML